jgi:hypothetical protein
MFKCRLLPLFLLFAASTASANDSVQEWSNKWGVYVSAGGCAISRAYADQTALAFPDLDSPELQISDRIEIRFHIQTAPETIKSGAFDIDNLYLWIYTTPEPVLSKYQQRITGVRIDSFDLGFFSNGEESPNKFQLFFLGKEDSMTVWKSFLRQDPPIVLLHLEDGSTKTIEAPAGPRDLFDKWARILAACSATDIPIAAEN